MSTFHFSIFQTPLGKYPPLWFPRVPCRPPPLHRNLHAEGLPHQTRPAPPEGDIEREESKIVLVARRVLLYRSVMAFKCRNTWYLMKVLPKFQKFGECLFMRLEWYIRRHKKVDTQGQIQQEKWDHWCLGSILQVPYLDFLKLYFQILLGRAAYLKTMSLAKTTLD